MRRILFFLIIAPTFSVCAAGTETSFLSPKATLHKRRKENRQVTLTSDPLTAPKVALVTFGPGRLYWERFGHNAIIVDDPATGTRIAYNYGVFDFQEQHFLLNFAPGHMHYRLV